MKKYLLFVLLSITFAGGMRAQVLREPVTAEQRTDDGILVAYPNPARDEIMLRTKDASTKIKTVSFYSILGVQVATYNVNASQTQINLERLKAGKYLVRYTLSDNSQRVTQIVKL